MAISKVSRSKGTSQREAIGLLAVGSSGPWQIDIDETTSGTDRWFAQIEGPSVYLYFELSALEIVDKAIQFLGGSGVGRNAADGARKDKLVLGKHKGTRVSLVRDDEFDGRYFFVMEGTSETLIRFTVANEELRHVTSALRQAKEDLADD